MPWKETFSSWYKGADAAIGSRRMIEKGEWILSNLPQLGVCVPPGSRIEQSLKLMKKIQLEKLDSYDIYETSEAQRTLTEFYFVGRTLLADTALLSPLVPQKLDAAVRGNMSDTDDRDTRARNTQAELIQYCVLAHAGLTPSLEEPDIQFVFADKRYSCAVKRLGSLSPAQVRRRYKDGVTQIEKSEIPGFVCLDVDIHIKTLVEPTAECPATERGQAFDSKIQPILKEHARHAQKSSEFYCGALLVGFARSDQTSRSDHTQLAAYYNKILTFRDVFSDPDYQDVLALKLAGGYRAFLGLGNN